jgi:hypothetical protein
MGTAGQFRAAVFRGINKLQLRKWRLPPFRRSLLDVEVGALTGQTDQVATGVSAAGEGHGPSPLEQCEYFGADRKPLVLFGSLPPASLDFALQVGKERLRLGPSTASNRGTQTLN